MQMTEIQIEVLKILICHSLWIYGRDYKDLWHPQIAYDKTF